MNIKRNRKRYLENIKQQRDLENIKRQSYLENIKRQRDLENIKRQRDFDQVTIDLMNEDETYLPTLYEAEMFRNYVLEYIDLFGKDDLQTNIIPQLFNVFLIDITKEILNDSI